MAEVEYRDCVCSNITIMQLFHQLKQRFPTVPDQVVSKVIEENHHNQEACESILRQEMHIMQSYPGALISGESRLGPMGPLVDHCPAIAESGDVSSERLPLTPTASNTCPNHVIDSGNTDLTVAPPFPNDFASSSSDENVEQVLESNSTSPSEGTSVTPCRGKEIEAEMKPSDDKKILNSAQKSSKSSITLEERLQLSKVPLGQLVREVLERHKVASAKNLVDTKTTPKKCEMETKLEPALQSEIQSNTQAHSSSTSELVKESHSPSCDISPEFEKGVCLSPRPSPIQSPSSSPNPVAAKVSPNRLTPPRIDTSNVKAARPCSLNVPLPVHSTQEYQVAVEYMVRPSPSDCPRPFTSVNLTLRPPSSDASSLPIEITSRQGLTYTTAAFDPKRGYQSQLQIRIGPAGGTITAYRKRLPTPRSRAMSRSPCRAFCHSRPHVRELLKQQRARKDLMARELRIEKEKLRAMQVEVKNMRAALECKPSPYVISKLRGEIERLRTECSKLTNAVDLYSEQSSVPLGETDQDFYRNIYTGQRQQRGWNCRQCTFRNHPLLSFCEECEMPRTSIGTSTSHVYVSNPLLNNNNSTSCSVEETSTSASRTIAPLHER